MYVINPGDEVFVPIFNWPNYPATQGLRKTSEWSEIKLTKESKLTQKQTCNDTTGYLYGGKILFTPQFGFLRVNV